MLTKAPQSCVSSPVSQDEGERVECMCVSWQGGGEVVPLGSMSLPLQEEVNSLKAMLRRSEDNNRSLRQQIQMLTTPYKKKGPPGTRRVRGEHVQDLVEKFSSL